MRKNIKNEKVLRAITIALATMITVSASPMAVLAEENAEPDNDTNTSGSEESSEETTVSEQSQTEETSTVEEVTEACDNAEAIIEGTSEAENAPEISLPETIDEAASAVAAVGESFVAPAETLNEIQADFTAAGELVGTTKTDVEAVMTNIGAASEAQSMAETMTTAASASVDTVNSGIETINKADTDADESIENAGSYAATANTAATAAEATAAANSAAAELASVEAGFDKANNAYEEASAAAIQAEAEYQAAEIAHSKAVDELNKANEAIRNAQGNATAAQERMKAAQAKVDALESKVNRLAENKEALENLRDNYYNFLVHYYRVDAKTAVYHTDGTLDIAASAARAKAESKTNIVSLDDKTMYVGRDLLKELVTLKLTLNGADADSIAFATDGTTEKDASAGTLTKDAKGNARVTVDDKSKFYKQYWTNQSGENGRNNRAKVTYTKDGVEHTEYYNYVAKASQYNDKMDLENGSIFLARVEEGADGMWHAAADDSEFAFDNFNKLLEAISIASAASEDMNEYNKAKEAVDAAAAEVDRLQAELDKINKITVDSTALSQLKAALEKAQADLADAKETRDALAGKVAQARAIVESIDLSRFDGNEELAEIAGDVVAAAEEAEAVAEDGTAVTAESTATATETSGTAAELTGAVETAEAATAVLGARAEAPATGDEEATGGAVEIKVESDNEVEEDAFAQPEKISAKKTIKIEDNEVPLADLPFENEDNISWWWLLLILLLGEAGREMYKKHQQKKEEAKAQA